jgi:hypothetical protein
MHLHLQYESFSLVVELPISLKAQRRVRGHSIVWIQQWKEEADLGIAICAVEMTDSDCTAQANTPRCPTDNAAAQQPIGSRSIPWDPA